MVEIFFSESAAASMKCAKKEALSHGPADENDFRKYPQDVICLNLMLDIGNIQEDVCGEYRSKLIHDMYNQYQWGEELSFDGGTYAKELRRLEDYLHSGMEIRIWYSRSPHSLCGLYFVCDLLKGRKSTAYAVSLPEYISSTGGTAVMCRSWDEVSPGELAGFTKHTKKLTPEVLGAYAALWNRLKQENSPLRVSINGNVTGVSEDFYDFLIFRCLSRTPKVQAAVIGKILSEYPLGVGDWWYARRIDCLIANGQIEVIHDDVSKYARTIRLK